MKCVGSVPPCHSEPADDHFTCNKQISDEAGWAGIRFVDADGVSAYTEFKVLNRYSDRTTLLEVKPHTGRTHQIRLHLWHLGYSIIGDPTYLPGQVVDQKQTINPDAPNVPARLEAELPASSKQPAGRVCQ